RSRPCSVIRLGDWKLHHYFEDDALELYHLRDDVSETKNLVDAHPDKTQDLLKRLQAWRTSINAPIPLAKAKS
ncbi:MAG: aryl-sulfate sulfohydrolase, partial [Verrucomicrobiales bacterium]